MGISTELLDICIPSGIFCYRNIKKATDDSENGEKTRSTVAFAQGAKIVEAITKYNDETAKNAFSIFDKYAKQSKIIDYTGKAVNWATHNVNPLICMSGAVKVLTSDDKVHTGITQTGALAGMFLGEGLMKLHMGKVINEQNITLKGLLFVGGSISSFAVGEKIGNNCADRICADFGIESPKKINQKV